MYEVSSKLNNGKVFKNRGKILGSRGDRGKFREKKMKTSQMPSQNMSMYEVSSKLNNGKEFKNRGRLGNLTIQPTN